MLSERRNNQVSQSPTLVILWTLWVGVATSQLAYLILNLALAPAQCPSPEGDG